MADSFINASACFFDNSTGTGVGVVRFGFDSTKVLILCRVLKLMSYVYKK